jgi:hypothetical protein
MLELQPYKNLHCRFVHDDRGRYCAIGDVCWLKPGRAEKILDEMARNGIESAIEPLEVAQDAPASDDLSLPTSPFDVGRVLSLNAKARRAIARSLGAPKNVRTKIADELIGKAEIEDLKAASAYYLEG